jgi:hypothetical protein
MIVVIIGSERIAGRAHPSSPATAGIRCDEKAKVAGERYCCVRKSHGRTRRIHGNHVIHIICRIHTLYESIDSFTNITNYQSSLESGRQEFTFSHLFSDICAYFRLIALNAKKRSQNGAENLPLASALKSYEKLGNTR